MGERTTNAKATDDLPTIHKTPVTINAVVSLCRSIGLKVTKSTYDRPEKRVGWGDGLHRTGGQSPKEWYYEDILTALRDAYRDAYPQVTFPNSFPTDKIDPTTGKLIQEKVAEHKS